jgi:hypothetical protein
VILVQLGIASIPIRLQRDWYIILATAAGIFLGSTFASLPQWAAEKVSSNQRSRHDFALTRSRGSKDVIIISGAGQASI